ncbi:MAG: CoA transferase [Rhodoferax sp.]
MSEPAHAALPLAGHTVVELGHSVAGPFAGQILSDLGARVLKVEKPQGDDARHWGPPFVDGASATFQALNRNKASVALDLRDPVQRTALQDFIATKADVVLQNMRPGQVVGLGLDAETLRARAPRLVYCNLGAFGAGGPLADRPGYDPLMQAFGGIMSVVGEPGGAPVRVGPSIVDMGCGMWGALGIVSLLMRRAAPAPAAWSTPRCWKPPSPG